MGEFTLTPTVKKILEGRGLKLVCSAPHCLVASKIQKNAEDNNEVIEVSHDELNAIRVKGHVECPNCNYREPFHDAVEYDVSKRLKTKGSYCSKERSTNVRCSRCGKIAKKVWTEKVVSRHIRRNHKFYHKECWENMAI